MNSLFKWLQAAPYLPEIPDPEVVKTEYRYWRIRILYSMFIGYAFYYFTRKSFRTAMPGLITDLGFDKVQLGTLGSILAITYGLSKFGNGIIGDRVNPRYMMAIGLIMTGICNILFGFSSTFLFFAIFWGLNGWFQGFGWPPCARFLTQWYSHSERGSWWSTWNVSHNVGGFLIPWVAGLLLAGFGWRYAMYVPGMLCILIGFFLINRLRDTPQSLGLPPIEKFRNDYEDKIEASEDQEKLTSKQILLRFVISNSYIWLLAVSYFFIYFVRTGVDEWTSLFLIESKGYPTFRANGWVSFLDIGGFFGSLAAGWSSDRLFGAKRGPINVIFTAGLLFSLIAFWFIPPGNFYIDAFSIFCIGFCVFGPQMMIGLAAAELSHKRAAASATGFVGFFASVGAACAGRPLGSICQYLGWEGFYLALIVGCLIPAILLLPLWSVTASSIRKKKSQKASGKDSEQKAVAT